MQTKKCTKCLCEFPITEFRRHENRLTGRCKTCLKEYEKWYRANRRPRAVTVEPPPEVHFWEKVDKTTNPNGCWEWKAARLEFGYGKVGWRGKTQTAHRVAWEIANGPIPEGLFVCHSCDNPACVNPNHLFLGTAADNTHDMRNKGRGTQGESHPNARFKDEDIRTIRKLRHEGVSSREIGLRYGVDQKHINLIIQGKIWKHVK